MKHIPIVAMIFAALVLSGCESMLVNAIVDYQDARNTIRGYIAENNADRKWVRQKCRESLAIQVAILQAGGNFALANFLLSEAYLDSITVAALEDGLDGVAEAVNTAGMCVLPKSMEPPVEPSVAPATS